MANQEEMLDMPLKAARPTVVAVRAGPIVLLCARLTLRREDSEETLGVPVVDEVVAAIRMLERERMLTNTR